MTLRFVGKMCVVAALSSTLVGVGAAIVTSAQAGAAVQKKHPPKHKKTKGSSVSDKLKALETGVAAEKGATFEVTYTTVSVGHTETVTFAQSPPKYLVKLGTAGSIIYTGKEMLYCATATECVSTTGATNPIAPIESLFSPTTAKDFFTEAEAEIAAKDAGYTVSFSTGTFAGLSSECATVSGHGHTGKYCVAKMGLLTYAGSAEGSITLKSYTSDVPSTSFTPPSGATIITEPTT